MLGFKRRGQEERLERFSTEEVSHVFEAITVQDIKVLKALEAQSKGMRESAIAVHARMSVADASSSVSRLGELGLVSMSDDAARVSYELDRHALREVVQRAPEAMFAQDL